jgi:hypothetical protein
MSDYRNYRINSITIPELDKNDKPTGIDLNFEVLSQEILTRTISSWEGGSFQIQEIVYVCFLNMIGRPKKLYFVNMNLLKDEEEIIVKTYQHENKELRHRSFKVGEKSNPSGRNLNS